MFERATFDWRVQHPSGEFTATFKRLPPKLLATLMGIEYQAALARQENLSDTAQVERDTARLRLFLKDVCVGWRDVATADGAALDFTPDNMERLLDYPGMLPALVAAYLSAIIGDRNTGDAPASAPQLH